MKSLMAAVACATMLAIDPAGSLAQPAKPTQPTAAATTPAAPPARVARPAKKRAWTRADARVCLEFPNNPQIIRCAEKYRYMRVPS